MSCVKTSRVLRSKEQFHVSQLRARTAAACRNHRVKVYQIKAAVQFLVSIQDASKLAEYEIVNENEISVLRHLICVAFQ